MARFAEAGADVVTFHYEATYNPKGCIEMIRNAGAKVGVSIKPPLRSRCCATFAADRSGADHERRTRFRRAGVHSRVARKDRAVARIADELGTETIIEVDGGISSHNAHEVFGAGADVLVAGNAVFGAEDPQAEIVKMLNA